MTKLLLSLPAAAALPLAGLAGLSAPAAAQGASNVQVMEVIVYGDDPCPRSSDSEIVVCARKPEAERYRIPERFREGGSLQSRQSWAARAQSFETVGATGTMTCSSVGPGGQTGCLQNMIDRATAIASEREEQDVPPPEATPPGGW
ncbi:MAG TPA: hypothetical protein VMK31_01350 [Sphingomicrobium sp.]|nr:hypothetical protein [Sphingomicrobium sp.]